MVPAVVEVVVVPVAGVLLLFVGAVGVLVVAGAVDVELPNGDVDPNPPPNLRMTN